jgi:hypothetical protein
MDQSGLPLDPNPYPAGSDIWKAYNHCLELEQMIISTNEDLPYASETIMKELGPRVVACVLGHALCQAPCDEGRDSLAHDIIGCNRDPELLVALTHLYLYSLICVCALLFRILSTITTSDLPLVCSVSAGQSSRRFTGKAVEHLKSSINIQELHQLVSNNLLIFLSHCIGPGFAS